MKRTVLRRTLGLMLWICVLVMIQGQLNLFPLDVAALPSLTLPSAIENEHTKIKRHD